MHEKAQETIKINPIVASGYKTVMPPNVIPTKRINMPLTVPLTVPPTIYAREISKLESGACKISGSCPNNFIWSIDDAEFEVAFVSAFIIISPGIMNIV